MSRRDIVTSAGGDCGGNDNIADEDNQLHVLCGDDGGFRGLTAIGREAIWSTIFVSNSRSRHRKITRNLSGDINKYHVKE